MSVVHDFASWTNCKHRSQNNYGYDILIMAMMQNRGHNHFFVAIIIFDLDAQLLATT